MEMYTYKQNHNIQYVDGYDTTEKSRLNKTYEYGNVHRHTKIMYV